jgi:hypothetical protein
MAPPAQFAAPRVAGAEPTVAHAIPSAADHMRTRDRAAVTLARRAPGVMRAITRMTVKERTGAE